MRGRMRSSTVAAGMVVILLGLWLAPVSLFPKEARKRERAFLGVSVQEVPRKYRKKYDLKRGEGVLVSYVVQDSPADYADIEEGDIILEMDGSRLKSPSHLSRLMRRHVPGDRVSIRMIHDGKEKSVTVKLSKGKNREEERTSIFLSGRRAFAIPLGWRPYLGVYLQDLNEDLAKYFNVDENSGVLVTEVEEESPAEDAGIKPGDILTQIDEEPVQSVDDALDILADYEPDDEVVITVIRSGGEKKLTAILEDRESENYGEFLFMPGRNRIRIHLAPLSRRFCVPEVIEDRIREQMEQVEEQIERAMERHRKFIERQLRERRRLRDRIEERMRRWAPRAPIQVKKEIRSVVCREKGRKPARIFVSS